MKILQRLNQWWHKNVVEVVEQDTSWPSEEEFDKAINNLTDNPEVPKRMATIVEMDTVDPFKVEEKEDDLSQETTEKTQ